MSAAPEIVTWLQVVVFFVEPINTLLDQVHGETRGVEEFVFDDHAPIAAIHAHALDLGRVQFIVGIARVC